MNFFSQGSIAYAKSLQKASLLTEEECTAIIDGLNVVKSEWANQSFIIQPGDEDIHTANERRLKVFNMLRNLFIAIPTSNREAYTS